MEFEELQDHFLRLLPNSLDGMSEDEVLQLFNDTHRHGEDGNEAIDKLIKDGYVTHTAVYNKHLQGSIYLRTKKGERFINSENGHVGAKQLKQELINNSRESLKVSKESLRVNKINTKWVIVGAIAAIVAALLAFC